MEATQKLWTFNGGLKLKANKKLSNEKPIAAVTPPNKSFLIEGNLSISIIY